MYSLMNMQAGGLKIPFCVHLVHHLNILEKQTAKGTQRTPQHWYLLKKLETQKYLHLSS